MVKCANKKCVLFKQKVDLQALGDILLQMLIAIAHLRKHLVSLGMAEKKTTKHDTKVDL